MATTPGHGLAPVLFGDDEVAALSHADQVMQGAVCAREEHHGVTEGEVGGPDQDRLQPVEGAAELSSEVVARLAVGGEAGSAASGRACSRPAASSLLQVSIASLSPSLARMQ